MRIARIIVISLIATGCANVDYTKLFRDLDSEYSKVRCEAAVTLGRRYLCCNDAQDRPPIEVLVAKLTKMLADKDRDVRASAADGLAYLGPKAKGAIPALIDLVKKDDDAIGNAIITLGNIGPSAKEALPHLLDASRSKRELVRQHGLHALGLVAPEDTKTLEALQKGLEDWNASVRTEAAATLGLIGPKAASTVPTLKKAASDIDPRVAAAAKNAIQRIEQR